MKCRFFNLSAWILGVILLAPPFLFAAEAQMKEEIAPFAGPPKEWVIYPHSVKLSADQKHLAYICRLEKQFAVVADGKMSAAYDGVSQDSPFLSPDGAHAAYRAVKGGKWRVVRDGKEGAAYEATSALFFSPDSKRLAYIAQKDDKEFVVVVDGKEKPGYSGVVKDSVLFSPDSSRLGYVAIEREKAVHCHGRETQSALR